MAADMTPCTPVQKTDRTNISDLAHNIERTPMRTPGGSRIKEEKIFVTVRLRPMSKKEMSQNDQEAWECVDGNKIMFKLTSQERSNTHSFDKVFGPNCVTEMVYAEGAKDVALSALTGINATIFAYGQTSSGKTYTMRGITENAVRDIYKHIENNSEREFIIKISAMEIYNEIVRDLLRPESCSLRLLDDPEKGTIVEKLEEETAKDSQHLRHLIDVCEAQRQVGETVLNSNSSRSHLIIRLTIESSLREKTGCVKSFLATLNFVDLAGSERAVQTHANGTRLKEGCHINRSLLTLTTVIRKLSQGKKGGHIPYRDSKLTRILQLSLGGNARTAIICTMSPALSHVEQSRNTLFFANCAKEVTNTAKVNVVVSEKQLVKQLQKEVARLEAVVLLTSEHSEAIIVEKDLKIKETEKQMEELKRERDLAQAQLDELRQKIGDDALMGLNPIDSSHPRVVKCLTYSGRSHVSDKWQKNVPRRKCSMRQSSTVPSMLVHEIRKLEQLQQQLGKEANRALEILQKEVACHRLGNQDAAETIAKLQAEIREMRDFGSKEVDIGDVMSGQNSGTSLKDEITRLQGDAIANLEELLENVQKSIDKLVLSLPNNNQADETIQKSRTKNMLPLTSSSKVNRPHLIKAPCSPMSSSRRVMESEVENMVPDNDAVSQGPMSCSTLTKSEDDGDVISGSEKPTPIKSEDGGDVSSREGAPCYQRSSSVNMKKMQKMFQNAAEENVRSIRAYVTELKERVAKLQYQKQLLVCQVLELEANDAAEYNATEADEEISDLEKSPDAWKSLFKEQMQQILQLWDVCNISIVHRTQFYLLFRGDAADQIYIEVELRRLTWLQQHFVEVGPASPAQIGDDSVISLSSSIRALRQEREFLCRRLNSRLSEEEREQLYIKWQVPLDGKQRKLQLVSKLWTDSSDQRHIGGSAQLVARLVGFCEGRGNITKEMFELNFAIPSTKKPWLLGWQPISNLLRL